MKKRQRFWLAALALSLLLTCAACGKQKAPDADAAPEVKQEQTTGKKRNTAKTDTPAKNEEKKDESKAEDKTSSDQKKTEGDKKSEETKKEDAQQETPKQEEQPKQEIDPATGKDKYQTDPVPEGKPIPVEPGTSSAGGSATCTFSISCATILNNWDKCDESKKPLVPADGVILPTTTVTFTEGESVFDVLQRLCRENGIHMESSWTPMYNSAYVEGINNLYEFDVGSLSGWMYSVNGWFPNYGCSRYALQNGDVVNWVYTCDLGYDVGGGYSTGS